MKVLSKSISIPCVTITAGLLGALARFFLYASGVDDRGLLTARHPLDILCWVITALYAVFLVAALRKLDGSNAYRDNFPVSKVGAFGAMGAAALLLIHMVFGGESDFIRSVLGYGAVVCLAFTGYCRLNGKRPSFLLHTVLCIYFAVEILFQWSIWSNDPQLPDYSFQLLACVTLMISGYQHAAFDVGLGRRRMQLACGLMAAMLCILSLTGPGSAPFYLCGAIWSLTSLCSFEPPARRHRSEPAQPEEA